MQIVINFLSVVVYFHYWLLLALMQAIVYASAYANLYSIDTCCLALGGQGKLCPFGVC